MVWSSGSLSPTRPAKDAVQLPKPRPWRPKDRDRGRRRSYQVEQVAPKPNALVVWSGRQKFSQSGPTETRRHSGYDKNFRSLVPPRLDGTRVQSFLLETSKKSKPWSGNVRPELHFAVWSWWSGPGYGVGARGRGSGEASSTRCVIFARLGGLQGFPGEVFASIREAPTELSEPWRPNRVQQVEGLPGPGAGRRSAGPVRLGALASKNSVQETDPRRRGFERRW